MHAFELFFNAFAFSKLCLCLCSISIDLMRNIHFSRIKNAACIYSGAVQGVMLIGEKRGSVYWSPVGGRMANMIMIKNITDDLWNINYFGLHLHW